MSSTRRFLRKKEGRGAKERRREERKKKRVQGNSDAWSKEEIGEKFGQLPEESGNASFAASFVGHAVQFRWEGGKESVVGSCT